MKQDGQLTYERSSTVLRQYFMAGRLSEPSEAAYVILNLLIRQVAAAVPWISDLKIGDDGFGREQRPTNLSHEPYLTKEIKREAHIHVS